MMGTCTLGHWLQIVLQLQPVFCTAGLDSDDCFSPNSWIAVFVSFGLAWLSLGEISSLCSPCNGASKGWELMYLGDMARTECRHMHGLKAQKHPMLFKVIRFIYRAPRFGIRRSGGLQCFECSLYFRYQMASSFNYSPFGEDTLLPAFKTQELEKLSNLPKSQN